MLTLTCIKWHKYHLNNQSNKIRFIVHIPIHHKILITPQIIVHKSPLYYTAPHDPSEMTGLFPLHHLVQPLHSHLHIILPLLSALMQHLSARLSNQIAPLALKAKRKQLSFLFITKTKKITFYNTWKEFFHPSVVALCNNLVLLTVHSLFWVYTSRYRLSIYFL